MIRRGEIHTARAWINTDGQIRSDGTAYSGRQRSVPEIFILDKREGFVVQGAGRTMWEAEANRDRGISKLLVKLGRGADLGR